MKHTIKIVVCLTTVMTVCLLGVGTVFSVSPDEEPFLALTENAGADYQNALIFFGESTTAHLRSRGVLQNGTNTTQVWANDSGTMLLSPKITSQKIRYPKTGEYLTIAEALSFEQPAYMVLSFGLNGILGFAENTDAYLAYYQHLIDTIQKASPNTAIIVQTVYPVAAPKNTSDWHFSQAPEAINQKIELLNAVLPTLAKNNGRVKIADTASVLRDQNGSLCAKYDTGDGIHLTAAAYTELLAYLRTHAYHLPAPLPIPPEYWRNHS